MTGSQPLSAAHNEETRSGLSEDQARARVRQYGFNEISEEPVSLLRGILKRLWGPIPWRLEISPLDDGTVEVDQSVLTGESAVVTRSVGEVMYAASTVRGGQATATVTATASKNYFGRTAELVRSARAVGHLDQLLFAVVRHLVTIDAMLAALLIAFALSSGADLLRLIPFLLVLVIATVPVTMPAAFTVANAVEARALGRNGILVTGLSAVQEAATMDVLCIDKTGTLTHNRQVITAIFTAGPSWTTIWTTTF